jgi:hypothetical protein
MDGDNIIVINGVWFLNDDKIGVRCDVSNR